MKKLVMMPDGWPCKYKECRPGFFFFDGSVCLKSEYEQNGYCDSGEIFWGGQDNEIDRGELKVQPLTPIWMEEE